MPLLDSICTLSDTASGFVELLDDLHTTILAHEEERTSSQYWSIIGQSTSLYDRYVCYTRYFCNLGSKVFT